MNRRRTAAWTFPKLLKSGAQQRAGRRPARRPQPSPAARKLPSKGTKSLSNEKLALHGLLGINFDPAGAIGTAENAENGFICASPARSAQRLRVGNASCKSRACAGTEACALLIVGKQASIIADPFENVPWFVCELMVLLMFKDLFSVSQTLRTPS